MAARALRDTLAPRQLARNVSGPVSAAPPRTTRSQECRPPHAVVGAIG